MRLYFIKRLLLFIPTLLIISLVAFGLSRLVAGDPLAKTEMSEEQSSGSGLAWQQAEISYREAARRMGLDKPAFYLTLTHAAYPDTFYRILHQYQRNVIGDLLDQYGCREPVLKYYHQVVSLNYAVALVPDSLRQESYNQVFRLAKNLSRQSEDKEITSILAQIGTYQKDSLVTAEIQAAIRKVAADYQAIKENATPEKTLIPALYWHGTDNQYHDWMAHLLSGDLGRSYTDSSVSAKILQALKNTIPLSALAILLIYLISVPLGVWSAVRNGQPVEKAVTTLLFILYAVPSFWLATMCIVFLPGAITSGSGAMTPGQIVVPVICLTVGSFAFMSRQMKTSMLEAFRQNYILTAKAKGLPFRQVVWKHAFRNALFPLITLFASVFPATVAGSFVIEYVFNINGMGRLLVASTQQMDWPVVFALIMLSAMLTMLGNFIADLLYKWADPRVKWR